METNLREQESALRETVNDLAEMLMKYSQREAELARSFAQEQDKLRAISRQREAEQSGKYDRQGNDLQTDLRLKKNELLRSYDARLSQLNKNASDMEKMGMQVIELAENYEKAYRNYIYEVDDSFTWLIDSRKKRRLLVLNTTTNIVSMLYCLCMLGVFIYALGSADTFHTILFNPITLGGFVLVSVLVLMLSLVRKGKFGEKRFSKQEAEHLLEEAIDSNSFRRPKRFDGKKGFQDYVFEIDFNGKNYL